MQERSRETLERLLRATEVLLQEKEFADITVREIVELADSSVGAFYKRFRNKDALLPYLLERILREQRIAIQQHFIERDWTSIGLRERLGMMLATSLEAARLKRGLLLAIVVRHLIEPEMMSPQEREESQRQFTALVDWLTECSDEIHHADPRLAVRMCLLMTISSIHQRVLSPSNPRLHEIELTDEQFVSELANASFAYLQFNQSSTETGGV